MKPSELREYLDRLPEGTTIDEALARRAIRPPAKTTTLRAKLTVALGWNGEDWADVESVTLPDEALDKVIEEKSFWPAVFVWTPGYVYFVEHMDEYDDSAIRAVPRHPGTDTAWTL